MVRGKICSAGNVVNELLDPRVVLKVEGFPTFTLTKPAG
jgi:hypothetical protein